MKGFHKRYSALYQSFSETPELSKFRRYLDVWSWILYNQITDIDRHIDECNDLIAELLGIPRDRCVFMVTDYHRAYDHDGSPALRDKVRILETKVRNYSQDLLVAQKIANMPEQCDVWARQFAELKDCFEDDVFGPTKGPASIYRQVPPHADTASYKGFDEQDPLTRFVLRYLKPAKMQCKSLVNRALGQPEENPPTSQETISFDTIMLVINLLTGIYVPLLFAGCMGVLSALESEKARIVVLGVFALLLTTSLIIFVPSLKRNDLFAVTAAFFAVGGIYIGTKSADSH